MMTPKAILLGAALALAAPQAMAEKPATGEAGLRPAQMSVEQIVQRNIAARGGLDAWRRIHSLSMSGKLDAGKERRDGGRIAMLSTPGARTALKAALVDAASGKVTASSEKVIQLPFRLELKRPLKSRLEITFQGDTAVQVFDGTQGWKLRPFLGRHEVEAFTESEARAASDQQALDGPLVDYAAKGTRVALDGMERVDGHDTYRLSLTYKSGDVRHVWIDARTFLEDRIEGAPRRFDGRPRTVWTYFRDYRSVDGVKVPFMLETRVDGVRGVERIDVEKVVLNPALDDARFAKML